MTTVISVLTTKDGQGSTSFALSLAWAVADQRRVMLIDADMSGTGNVADMIALDTGSRGIGSLFGTLAVSAAMLEQQATPVRARPRLRVVAGLQGFSGPGVGELVPRLSPALRSLTDELVVLDLGAALAHPRQESARETGEAICAASQRVFIVMHDSPTRLVRSIQVLKAAQLPQAELVVYETRRGALRGQLTKAFSEHLPGTRLTAFLPWDERRAARAEDAAVPIPAPNLLDTLRILPAGALQEAGSS
jgi:MinD-like ATPase involved in chromosome partitioning or flagellar assembly